MTYRNLVSVRKPWSGSKAEQMLLAQLPALYEIRFEAATFQDSWLLALKDSKQLRAVYLDFQNVSDKSLYHLKGLKLEALGLSGTAITREGFSHLEAQRHLKYLGLLCSEITDESLKSVGKLRNLESLNLDATATTRRGYIHLQGLTKLRWLRLSRNAAPGPELSFARMKSLEFLDARQFGVTDAECGSLSGLPMLECLRLGGSSITDRGLKALASNHSLRSLDISSSRVTNKGLVSLLELKSLWWLDLSGTEIDDSSVQTLLRLPRLDTLGLGGTRISAQQRALLKKKGIALFD